MRWIFKKELGEGKSDFYYIEKTQEETRVLGVKWSDDSALVRLFCKLQDEGYEDLNLHKYTEEEIQEMISASMKDDSLERRLKDSFI